MGVSEWMTAHGVGYPYEVDPNGYQTESEYEDTEKHALLKRINAYRGDGFISYSVSS